MSDGPTPEDVLQVAQRALAKANDLERSHEDLREEHDDTVEELTALRLRVSELLDENDHDYRELSTDERVGLVREHVFRKAIDSHGRATVDYTGVKWEVFDGGPSADYCYKLMRLAAGLTDAGDERRPTGGEYPGFTCRDPDGGNYHLAVDAEAAKQSPAFSSAKKDGSEGVGSR